MGAAYGSAPPPELKTAWNCHRWNTLPDAGGYFDQDAALLERMNLAENVYNAAMAWQSKTGKAIHTLTVHERKMIRWLRDNRYM